MENLHEEMQQRNKMLTINVIPHGSTQHRDPEVYDFRDLSRVTDAIILMAYDKHGFSPEIGPVAPLDWVTNVVEHAINASGDPQGIILGLAAYGYRWTVGENKRGEALPLQEIKHLLDRLGIKPERTDTGIPHFTYTEGGKEHVVWYEDEVSIRRKLELAREKQLHGIAIWRVGLETPEYWHTIQQGIR